MKKLSPTYYRNKFRVLGVHMRHPEDTLIVKPLVGLYDHYNQTFVSHRCKNFDGDLDLAPAYWRRIHRRRWGGSFSHFVLRSNDSKRHAIALVRTHKNNSLR